MRPNEHYTKAEAHLRVFEEQIAVIWEELRAGNPTDATALSTLQVNLAAAQVHATLATAFAPEVTA